MRLLDEHAPDCITWGFSLPEEALAYIKGHAVDAVFCDMEMPGMNGIAFARDVKAMCPEAHIVFAASYADYALDAFSLHATGYLLKPVDADEFCRELAFIYDHNPRSSARLQVQTFGSFFVAVDEEPLVFRRRNTYELLALLVDRRGQSVTSREASDLLWEGEPYGKSKKSYYQSDQENCTPA